MCFDELILVLDLGLMEEVVNLIKSMSEKGMSMMIIIYDMSFVKKVVDRIVFMNKG